MNARRAPRPVIAAGLIDRLYSCKALFFALGEALAAREDATIDRDLLDLVAMADLGRDLLEQATDEIVGSFDIVEPRTGGIEDRRRP